MPLKRCGKDGWKWGDAGRCYGGGMAGKKKAIAQALAIGGGKMPVEKSEEDVELDIPVEIKKQDEEKQMVLGWANISMADGELIVDSHGDTISVEELEAGAYNFMLTCRESGINHEGDVLGQVVESFMVTPEKLEILGLEKNALPLGWWIGVKVESTDIWKSIRDGELKAFSIQGRGKREKL